MTSEYIKTNVGRMLKGHVRARKLVTIRVKNVRGSTNNRWKFSKIDLYPDGIL
jgi:hypothetical protein